MLKNRTSENEALISHLNQYRTSFRFGYNLHTTEAEVISIYTGLRYSHYQQITSPKNNLTIDEYLKTKELIINIEQYQSEIGVNYSFMIDDNYSMSFYFGYLISLHKNPYISNSYSEIQSDMNNPNGVMVIGIGFGLGINGYKQ